MLNAYTSQFFMADRSAWIKGAEQGSVGHHKPTMSLTEALLFRYQISLDVWGDRLAAHLDVSVYYNDRRVMTSLEY